MRQDNGKTVDIKKEGFFRWWGQVWFYTYGIGGAFETVIWRPSIN